MEAPQERSPAPPLPWNDEEEELKKFAALLGMMIYSGKGVIDHKTGKELAKLFSNDVRNDDVVLSLPSLDTKLEDGANSNDVLPKVGDSAKALHSDTSSDTDAPEEICRPSMVASVLTGATANAADVENKAAQNLGNQTSWTKSTLTYASHAVATNVSESFDALVTSRVKQWTLLLLRHSLSTGDAESRSRLLNILQTTIKVESTETKFKTLPLPEYAAGTQKDADIILPLLFEVVISLQERPEKITLRTPGTISAHFIPGGTKDHRLRKVDIRLDTGVMLKSMVDQARLVVFKAVATATKTNVPQEFPKEAGKNPNPTAVSNKDPESSSSTVGNTSSLAGFRSVLSLSPLEPDQSPRLQKAHVSALKLNGILHGRREESHHFTTPLGMRKSRSVKWDSPMQLPTLTSALAPTPKKQRIANTAAKLKSFKSFGRPHGGDFGSGPRNATFADYGRQAVWGRHGRMVHHPTPMESQAADDLMGAAVTAEKNETFDWTKIKRVQEPRAASGGMQRTATFLENWLMKKSTSGGER